MREKISAKIVKNSGFEIAISDIINYAKTKQRRYE